MPRSRSMSIQSDTTCLSVLRPRTAPASSMAPAYSRSFSVSVVLPASGWEMMAKVRRRSTSLLSAAAETAVSILLKLLEEFYQFPAPKRRKRVGAVAAGLVADRDQDEAPVFHLLDQLLHHRQLGRIDEIVSRVNRQQGRGDLREVRRRVVVLDRVVVVQHVVRVGVLRAGGNLVRDIFVGRGDRWKLFLPLQRHARRHHQETDRAGEAARLLGVIAVLPRR